MTFSPILYVIQNEVDAFWCFCGFMELVQGNFEESQETMKRQLGQLLLLLKVLDQPLCDFLDSQDSGSLSFCFRWLLIWFKREFPFTDILRLWEVLWTGLPGPNLHLLVACAILDMERDTLMLSGFGSNEILKHINELTMKLSVEDVLTRAEVLYRQLTACPELPHNVQEVLGLALPAEPRSPSPPGSPLPLSPTHALRHHRLLQMWPRSRIAAWRSCLRRKTAGTPSLPQRPGTSTLMALHSRGGAGFWKLTCLHLQ